MPYGTIDHPCAANSRWRKFTFIKNDFPSRLNRSGLSGVLRIQGSGPYVLKLDSHPRTVVQNLVIANDVYANYTFDPEFEYKICEVTPGVGGTLAIKLSDGSCQNIHNPVVNFNKHENSPTYVIDVPGGVTNLQPIDEQWTNGEELILTRDINDSSCKDVPLLLEYGDPPIFGKVSDGTWLQFDPRLNLQTNTISNPRDDGGHNEVKMGGGTLCMDTPQNFLNDNDCLLSSVATFRLDDPSKTCGALVCGSQDEVGNKKKKGHMFDIFDKVYQEDPGYSREYVWMMIALSASDQLRQRVAWALSQVCFI